VRQVINKAYNRALEVMSVHRDLLDKLAHQLELQESLTEEEVDALFAATA
jgi:ATP-dependent Zn protease